MPIFEFRCKLCAQISSAFSSAAERPESMPCDHCGAAATRIISRPSVRLSMTSKMEKLDPKYDRMVDKAMRNTPEADPDRHLRKLRPLSDS